MLHILKLYLPALLPSWRFFDVIAPSPRIQYSVLKDKNEIERQWCEFRPRPAQLKFARMLWHLLWNQKWNESLFLVSCAERLLEQPTEHSENEIMKRIRKALITDSLNTNLKGATHLQFRLLLVQRKDSTLQKKVVFHSKIDALSTPGAM